MGKHFQKRFRDLLVKFETNQIDSTIYNVAFETMMLNAQIAQFYSEKVDIERANKFRKMSHWMDGKKGKRLL